MFSPMGANPMNPGLPAATEEDVTYIVGKNQANKIVENRKFAVGITRQEDDDPTIIGVRRDFNAGIQQRDMPDITVEIT